MHATRLHVRGQAADPEPMSQGVSIAGHEDRHQLVLHVWEGLGTKP